MIRIPQVRVVDEEGAQLGVMPTPQALEMAQERGYDLVEVAPMAQPPVVKFLDFGQYKYELTKREKESQAQAALGHLQGGPPVAEDRRRRLRHQGPSRDRVPRGRRSDQGDGPLPGSGADPSGDRAEPDRQVRGASQGSRDRGTDAAARGQVDAHHDGIDSQAQEPRCPGPQARAGCRSPADATAVTPDRATPPLDAAGRGPEIEAETPAATRRDAGTGQPPANGQDRTQDATRPPAARPAPAAVAKPKSERPPAPEPVQAGE